MSFLRKVGLFSHLDLPQLALIESICQQLQLPEGWVLFREGDEPEHFFVIMKGQVKISRSIPGLGEETLAILDAGSYLGEMEIFEPKPRAAQAVAHTACTLQAIKISALNAAMNADRELTIGVLWSFVLTLSERLRNTNDKVTAHFAQATFTNP
jgi:CRP-like cAMP-binding protein